MSEGTIIYVLAGFNTFCWRELSTWLASVFMEVVVGFLWTRAPLFGVFAIRIVSLKVCIGVPFFSKPRW